MTSHAHSHPRSPAPAPAPSPTANPSTPDDPYLAFWRERHLCTLTTLRPDGSPHVVPVGVTYDPGAGLARVITSGTSAKVSHVRAAGPEGARVAVCQVDGRRWATLEGRARVRTEPEKVAEAERRYTERYRRTPRENPARVVIEIEVERTLGHG
ncbi:pyridoxamine 5'-phosphate oxidase family protein [Streptomyces sp. NPDC048297]|uniref:pyridoxamine 5'-phosphate oxidase family protein n=1 Tax=Streptomyces sp. NPDC048297 TaxID=3365531 RepID=UPI0037196D83